MNQAKEHVSSPKVLNAQLKTFSVDNLRISAGMSDMQYGQQNMHNFIPWYTVLLKLYDIEWGQ